MVSAPHARCAAISCQPARGHFTLFKKRMPQLLVVSAESSCHSTLVSHQRHRAPRCWAAGEALQGPTCCCTASTLHAACSHAGCMVCREGSSAANSRHTPQLLSPSWQRPGGHRCPLNRQWTALSHTKVRLMQLPSTSLLLIVSGILLSLVALPARTDAASMKGQALAAAFSINPTAHPSLDGFRPCSAATAARPRYQPAVATSTARVGPRCQCAPEHNRTRDQGCPYSLGRRVCPCNSLAHNFPEVAAEWDKEANGLNSPELIVANSHKGAGWQCETCDNRWTPMVSTRTGLGRGCPRCANKSGRIKEQRPSIALGAAYLLTE